MTRSWDELVELGRAAADALGDLKWLLGDLALEVAPAGVSGAHDDGRLRRYADAINVEVEPLRGYRQVALAWPPATRVAGAASWSAHRAVRAHPDRFALLKPGMTVREAQRLGGVEERKPRRVSLGGPFLRPGHTKRSYFWQVEEWALSVLMTHPLAHGPHRARLVAAMGAPDSLVWENNNATLVEDLERFVGVAETIASGSDRPFDRESFEIRERLVELLFAVLGGALKRLSDDELARIRPVVMARSKDGPSAFIHDSLSHAHVAASHEVRLDVPTQELALFGEPEAWS